MTDKQWPESLQPATPLVVKNMTERERDEAEEARRLAAMTDVEMMVAIRRHLTKTFIGRETVDRRITKDDGTPGVITVRKAHRYVSFFDALVRNYTRRVGR